MPTYNYKARELIAKVVYYGPGRCGKTTNLQQIHARMRPETRSELLSVATETDRTIYFDLLPLNLGTISGMKFMVRLFTVPGQVYYSETRKLVLRGADGVVFVADSQDHMMDENRESLQDLKANLKANGLDYSSIPIVFQWNKRDLPRLIPEAELNATLNDRQVRTIPAVAVQGQGVLETLRYATVSVFNHIKSGGKVSTPVVRGQSRPSAPPPGVRSPSVVQHELHSRETEQPTKPVAVAPPRPRSIPPPPPPRSEEIDQSFKNLPPAPSGNGALHAVELAEQNPASIGTQFIIDEFRLLAIVTSQLTERLSTVEQEVKRLGSENQELRELLTRRPRP